MTNKHRQNQLNNLTNIKAPYSITIRRSESNRIGRLLNLNFTNEGVYADLYSPVYNILKLHFVINSSSYNYLQNYLAEYDLIAIKGMKNIKNDKLINVKEVHLLAKCKVDNPHIDLKSSRKLEIIKKRGELYQFIREFFRKNDFLEVETPIFNIYNGPTPTIDDFKTYYNRNSKSIPFYLQTSPEIFMKQLLVEGLERIYQICKCFRNGEAELSSLHNPEFVMLEWYQAYADYTDIMNFTEELLSEAILTLNGDYSLEYQGKIIDWKAPWDRYTIQDLMLTYTGIDIASNLEYEQLLPLAKEKKISISDKDDWDSLFFKLFLELVEPHLGKEKPVFVLDYPPSMCALARKKSDNIQWAERFEIYAGGLELANAFTELNDQVEQRFRLENDSLDGLIDENFLSALECAMPPAGGIALGLDRLLMLLLDIDKIEDVLTFHFPIT